MFPDLNALTDPREAVRQRLGERVRGFFRDADNDPPPVVKAIEGAMFAPDSPIRAVHGDVAAMLVGGMSALLMQMLHPHALQGVLDFSDFRQDLHGRLRRTSRFVAVTTYGREDEALAAIAQVNAIHTRVRGTLADGTPYSATDPRVLGWVHLAGVLMFLRAHLLFVAPDMTFAQRDEYVRQMAEIGRRLGADPVPVTVHEAFELCHGYQPQLAASGETRALARYVLNELGRDSSPAIARLFAAGAVETLPPIARRLLGLESHPAGAIASTLGIRGVGRAIRWSLQ